MYAAHAIHWSERGGENVKELAAARAEEVLLHAVGSRLYFCRVRFVLPDFHV